LKIRNRSHAALIRRTAGLVIGVALIAGTAACGSTGGSTTLDKKADVKITVWTGQTEASETVLEGLAKDFEKLHPNVTVDMSAGASTTDDLLQKVSAAFAGGTYPDMSYAYGSWASQLEESGRTLDITKDVADPAVNWEDFTAAARATAQPNGKKTIGYPAIVDNISLIFNKTVFDKAGLAYPTDDWSWDDFRAAAKQLTDASTNTYGYGYSVSGSEDTTWQFWPHLWQRGGAILSDDGKSSAFNSQAGIDALTFLQGMAVDDKSVYLDQTDTKYPTLFASDHIAMMTSGPWTLGDLKTAGTKYGVVVLPGFNGDHQTVSGPDIWALFDHKDANRAYWVNQFAEWLTSAD
jgi:multiple sugar transport system substrate-binding protein